MKPKFIFLLFCILCLKLNVSAQSIYQFKYNYNSINNSNNYSALLVMNQDGSGFMRIRYITSDQEDMLIHLDIAQVSVKNTNGEEDTNSIYVKTFNPNIIQGNFKLIPDSPVILFVYDKKAKFLIPKSIIRLDVKEQSQTISSLKFNATLLMRKDIRPEFLQMYMDTSEDFYKDFFILKSKSITAAERSITLHLIVVVNTIEPHIAGPCQKDMMNVIEMFTNVKNYLGINLDLITVAGKFFSKAKVEDVVQKLKVNPQDIIFFYFNGHGFRDDNERKRLSISGDFPFMDLRSDIKKDAVYYSLNSEIVYKNLLTKHARMTMLFSDCCNTDVGPYRPVGSQPLKGKSSGSFWNEQSFRTLFLGKPMNLIASACENGQYATINPALGGFFTYYFKTALEAYCTGLKPNVSWDAIFKDALQNTTNKANTTYCSTPRIPENICRQFPLYRIGN